MITRIAWFVLCREGILNGLEDIPPAELFEQFFVSLVSYLTIKEDLFHFFSSTCNVLWPELTV